MSVDKHSVTVSVIVPSYNYAHYLIQRLRTIIDQTYQDFEVIIIDDASTDKSPAIISEFESDSRVTAVYCSVNSGSVYQRWNEAATLAKGRYLWFAGADDYCEPTLLEELVAQMQSDPSVGIAFTQSRMVDHEGRERFRAPTWQRSGTRKGWCARRLLLLDTTIANASGVLLRTDIFRDVGGFDLSYRLAADWKLYLDMLSRSDLSYVGRPLNYCRIHPFSVSLEARRSGAEPVERYRLIDDVCSRSPELAALREPALDREAQRCLINAMNAVRRGGVRPALRILSAGSTADERHTRRMLRQIPHLGGAIRRKLVALTRTTFSRRRANARAALNETAA